MEKGSVALILGTFDGVHSAHKELILCGKKLAESVVACTFSLPPSCVFDKNTLALSTAEEKRELLLRYGVDSVFMRDFDSVKTLSAEEYIKMLCDMFHPSFIIAGFNHRFGKGAEGDFKVLSGLSRKYGFKAEMVLPVRYNGEVVSSTLIRSLLAAGETEKANALLGHNYSVTGIVEHGRQIGTGIGFPTANISVAREKLVPLGVYASFAQVGNRRLKAITNIGFNPTAADGNRMTVEAHIMGFSENIYGETVTTELVKKLRDERKFGSLEALKQQLANDAALTDALLS